MIELLPALTPLSWGFLILTTVLAGGIYGFTGFGSALIFMPVGAALLSPEAAVLCMALFALTSAVTVLPGAWAAADRRAALIMLGAAAVALWGGTWVLKALPTEALRWGIAALVGLTLVLLVSGWRMARAPRPGLLALVGAASGFLGGAVGLPGPPVILFNLSSGANAARVRAGTLMVLTLLGLLQTPALWARGLVTQEALAVGCLLAPLYGLGTRAGHWLFDPALEQLYRRVAYATIGAAALAGLPIWG